MKQKLFVALFLIVFIATHYANGQEAKIKVACVGNSITQGSGLADAKTEAYPAQLQKLLGTNFEVGNFGKSGATLLAKGDKPYFAQTQWADAKAFRPQIVIIKLGTNDTKPQNNILATDFERDYKALIDTLRQLGATKFIICEPMPIWKNKFKIIDSVAVNVYIPLLKKIAKAEHAQYVSWNKKFRKQRGYFPDGVHPNANGAKAMATYLAPFVKKAAKAITKQ